MLVLSLIILCLVPSSCFLSAPPYNQTLSQQFHNFCLITHCRMRDIEQWSCPLCRNSMKLIDVEYMDDQTAELAGYVGYSPDIDRVIVVFRGTQNTRNWIQDFSFLQVTYFRCQNCKIHDGFYLTFLTIQRRLNQAVSNIRSKHKNSPIVMIGSSLGAAITTIAALQLQLTLNNIESLHTFGSPRIGNADLIHFISLRLKNIVRVVHNRDIVPHLPLLQQNYVHLATQIFFNEEMTKFKMCDDSGEDPTCSDQFPTTQWSISDHTSYWGGKPFQEICGK